MRTLSSFFVFGLISLSAVAAPQGKDSFDRTLEKIDKAVDAFLGEEDNSKTKPEKAHTGVTSVRHKGGYFVQSGPRAWKEFSGSNNTFRFNFKELSRNNHSIFLIDENRDMQIQLDLKAKQIRFAESGQKDFKELYTMTSTQSGVNGYLAEFVAYPNGKFLYLGNNIWSEKGNDGSTFTFAETLKDVDSVYLLDQGRNVRIKLDISKREVSYAAGKEPFRKLYDITTAR